MQDAGPIRECPVFTEGRLFVSEGAAHPNHSHTIDGSGTDHRILMRGHLRFSYIFQTLLHLSYSLARSRIPEHQVPNRVAYIRREAGASAPYRPPPCRQGRSPSTSSFHTLLSQTFLAKTAASSATSSDAFRFDQNEVAFKERENRWTPLSSSTASGLAPGAHCNRVGSNGIFGGDFLSLPITVLSWSG